MSYYKDHNISGEISDGHQILSYSYNMLSDGDVCILSDDFVIKL